MPSINQPPLSAASTVPVPSKPISVDTLPTNRSVGFVVENALEEQFIGAPAVLVKPEQNQRVFLAGDGRLYEKQGDRAAYVLAGQVQPDGWFQLVDGQQGFLFHNPLLRFNPFALGGPLGRALQSVQEGILKRSAETDYIRQNLTRQGIDGRGTRVFFIEPGVKSTQGEFMALDHTRLVRATVNDPSRGYAPGAMGQSAVFLVEESDLQLNPKVDTTATAQDKFITDMANSFHRVATLVASVAQTPAPQSASSPLSNGRQIINMSIGLNPLVMAEIMYTVLEQKTPEGGYLFSPIRFAYYGPGHASAKQSDKMNALIERSMVWFQTDPRIQQAMAHYQQAVQQATAAGIPVVVAAGNEQNTFPTQTRIPQLARFNWLALPNDVICVAASNNNQTPANVTDDTISDFSNHGDVAVKNPTVAATGENVFLDKYYSDVAPGGAASGTSFASPIISATLAMMFQVAPSLSVPQAKGLLQQAAYGANTTPATAGAGIVDPVAAVRLTLQQVPQLSQAGIQA